MRTASKLIPSTNNPDFPTDTPLSQKLRAKEEVPSGRRLIIMLRGADAVGTTSQARMRRLLIVAFLLLYITTFCSAMTVNNKKLVAVTGATGRLGRRAVVDLSKLGVPTRCLVRRDIPADTKPDLNGTSVEVAAYLKSLPSVELVKGDVTNEESIETLMKDCTSVLSLHGPVQGSPWKSLLPPLLGGTREDDPTHSRMINYVGLQYMIQAAQQQNSKCSRIVRITGKGEDPYGIFSILINMLGTMAKAWNYEGEELLRQSGLNYTIIRPGIMGSVPMPGKVKALKDDGQDLPVSKVSYDQIADLAVECLDYDNAAKSTLTAMNVPDGEGELTYAPLLKEVHPDQRDFPSSLLAEHKNAARLGAAVLVAFAAVSAKIVIGIASKIFSLFR